ncbi:hypothetical protein [Flavobacterium sp.]|uniref:hypothetical protein n=1 Tax=Flavobacterium sp. TaxID=239 RepID=UPI000EEED8E7|nr:hypothetical protein [Flavobacterium sp.]HCQ14193.1 hypothetical protein [Flavobacterium sp.]
MRKLLITSISLIGITAFSQEHFAGLTTSNRVGVLSATNNPAELVNMSHTFEVGFYSLSANVSNNKIGINDLFSDSDLETILFTGNDPVNLRVDTEIYGPSFGMKYKKLAFAITTKITGKLDVVDVDPNLGDGLVNAGLNSLFGSTTISNDYNQRLSGTTWGEVGLTGAMNIINNAEHKFNVGATFKLLFPGSYSNLGLDKFNGTITNTAGDVYLSNVNNVNLNIAYSGGLADNFSNVNDYTKSLIGGLNGFSGDLGINYQWRDQPEDNPKKNQNKYKLNAGLSVRNIGSMTFKDDNNYATNYVLNIPSATIGNPGLNLNQFQNVENLQEVEEILINEGYLNKVEAEKNEFTVKLPTTITAYADVKLIPKVFISGFLQQKLNENNGNDQITAQNIVTITPRFTTRFFEVFAPFSNTEIAGFSSGVGFRIGGFYLGSSSVITALASDNSKQADIYTGFRWGFL